MTEKSIVLYVEDDARSREVLSLFFKYTMRVSDVTFFEDSSNFDMRIVALNPKPNIVLLDIHMSPHNGFDMLKMLRDNKDYDAVPIVALTASVMNEEIQRLRSAGFHSVIPKPVDMDSLAEVLQGILAGKHFWSVND